MKTGRRKIILILLLACVGALLCVTLVNHYLEEQPVLSTAVPLPANLTEPAEELPLAEELTDSEPSPTRITLVAVGDNLLHMPIINWCRTESGYDFTTLYAEVKELVSNADLAFVNQESPLGGASFAPSGYPMFNSPQEAGAALAATGFDIVSQANNHALDKGAKAVVATADFWQEQPTVTFIGINRSEEEQAEIRVVEAQGYRFAWLAYSYGTNGMPMAYSYLMNLIDREAMAADIAKAREQADAVIVSMHWGNEYQLTPSTEQRQLAQFLADEGVTLVVGHHPHVVQPLEWLTGKDGGSTLVIYSLGNFVSNQARRNTMLEGMLSVVFTADEAGISIEGCGVIPLVMHYERGYQAYCVYPLYAYTEDLARRHYINQLDRQVSLEFFSGLATEIWGDYCIMEEGRLTALIPAARPTRLASGGAHSLAIKPGGVVWAWGYNEFGALGNDNLNGSLLPQRVLENAMAVSAGSRHSLALTKEGTLLAWGRNNRGQLGDGTTEDHFSPVRIMDEVQAVSSSDWHTLALKMDGSLWAWGFNFYGQLGDGSTEDRLYPVHIMDNVTGICAGADTSAAITEDGSLWLWGRNNFGQLGDGSTEDKHSPIRVMENVAAVSVRNWHSAALRYDGSLWTWGRNNMGQLGDGNTDNSALPVRIMDNTAALAVGNDFTLAVLADGVLLSWGGNQYGQLGDGNLASRPLPKQIMTEVTEISAGGSFALAMTEDGALWAWGENSYAQLGDGTAENRAAPVKIW